MNNKSFFPKACALTLMLICLSAVLICGYRLFGYYMDINRVSRETQRLRDIRLEDTSLSVLSEFESLLAENTDTVGWLRLAGTAIDYPVMQSSADDPEFYLTHNFKKAPDPSGVPFLDYRCNIYHSPDNTSDNLILYGHNMKSGLMFHDLTRYEDFDFWSENKIIYFDTLYFQDSYEVFAVFKYDLTSAIDSEFNIIKHVDYSNAADFDEFISYVKGVSLHATDNTASYGDKLLTLITCEYSSDDSRFVVVAKKQ